MSEQRRAVEPFLEADMLTASGWGRALHDGVLLGQRCPDCDHVTAAPKAACARCGTRELVVETLPETGTVYTETTIAVTPAPFAGPYRVGIVDLGEASVLGRIPETAGIGDEVILSGVVDVGPRVAPLFE